MKTLHFLLVAATLVSAAPASALDRVLPAPRIKDNGDVRLSDDLKIGRYQGGKFISQPDAVQIQGSGSTGDVSETSVKAAGTSVLRALSNRFLDRGVNVLDYGPSVGTGGDDSAAINAAINAAGAPGGPSRVNFPPPPSGYYNVCADSVRIVNNLTPISVELFGLGAGGGPTIRTLPSCTSGGALNAVAYIEAGYSALPKSANRVSIANLRFDGWCKSKFGIQANYAAGLSMRDTVIRNSAPGNGANLRINSGYEYQIDSTVRLENINDTGHVCYTGPSTMPDYNLWTNGSDSNLKMVAINARVAHVFNESGGNNNYINSHVWGYPVAGAESAYDLRAQYGYLINGRATLIGAVADSPLVAGYYLTNTAFGDNGGAVLTNSMTFGPMPVGAFGLKIAPEVRNTIVANNNFISVPNSPTYGIDVGTGLDPSNTVINNQGSLIQSGVVKFGGGANQVLAITPDPTRTYFSAVASTGSATDPSALEFTATGQYGFLNFKVNNTVWAHVEGNGFYVDAGGGLQVVSRGAADSGGAGFRVLRVPN